MHDEEYFRFIQLVLMSLEPRKVQVNDEIVPYRDNVYEMFFMSKGEYEVGYQFGGHQKYCLRIQCQRVTNDVIGGFNCMFAHKNYYFYRARAVMEGFIIRRRKFIEISKEFEFMIRQVKSKIFWSYNTLRTKVF